MSSRVTWFLLGAAAAFLYCKWDTIRAVVENRQRISQAQRAIDGGRAAWDLIEGVF